MTIIQQFDYSAQLDSALVWQYNQAAKLQSLVDSVQAYFDVNQTEFWQNWYANVFNVYDPAFNKFGATIWSIILGMPLQVNVMPDEAGKPIFMFDQTDPATPVYSTFDVSVFSYDNRSIALSFEEQILVLKLRAFQLNNRCAVTQINEFMQKTFAGFEGFSGTCYVEDGGLTGSPMTMSYVFTQALPAGLVAIFTQFDILPRPAGVSLKFVVIPPNTWGFDNGSEFDYDVANFDNGPFFQTFSPPP
jgi:hypothetical protein